jgi:hypothetical protein
MKTKIIAVRAPEHLIDLGLKSDVDGVLGVLDHGVENHEPAPIFQHPQHFFHHSFGIVKVMKTKRHEGAIESVRLKRQRIRLSSALTIRRNRICVLVPDVEHRKRLINTNDPTTLEPLRHRPSHSTGPRRDVENPLIALQDKHFSQFLGEISTNSRGSAIKLRRVLRIMEMSFVPVPVAMPVFVIVSMLMVVTMFVIMAVLVVMSVGVLVFVIVRVAALVVMLMFVAVIVLMFVFVVFAHNFIIPFKRKFNSSAPSTLEVSVDTDLKSSTSPSYPIKPVSFKDST